MERIAYLESQLELAQNENLRLQAENDRLKVELAEARSLLDPYRDEFVRITESKEKTR